MFFSSRLLRFLVFYSVVHFCHSRDTVCIGGIGTVPLEGTDDCVCRPGFHKVFREDGSDGCVLCPANHFCSGGERLGDRPPQRRRLLEHGVETCPANSSAPAGTNHSQGCICDRGYYGPSGGPCELCPANSWCWGGVEKLCPLGIPISPAGASSAEDCACVAGEYCMFPEEPINKQVDVSNYAHGFCYIDATDHALYCWGQAFDAWYEGTNEMYSIPLPPGRHAIDVEVGSIGGTAGSNSPDPENVLKTHVCVHLDDLTVKCFGSNVGDVLGSNYSNKLNGTYPNTTDEVRAQGGLQFAANSLVYANSGYDTDPLKVWAHFCGLNSGDHKVVTCWGTSGWSTTKTFDTNVRGVFAYAHGTFAVLEDNSVLQWGEYGRGSFIVGGEGAGGAQSLRQWFPPKTVRSIVSVQKNVVCFQFTDHTFSCTGQNNAVRNLDYSKEGADGQVANARNWPLITFGNGTRVKSLVGSTHKFVHVLSDTDELLIVPETGFRPETILPPDPSNPIVKILLAFETQKSLFGIVVARADGSWYTAGNARGGAFGAITAKTGAIPLLEYGMPDMDMCECTLCEAGFFCPGGRHKDQCPAEIPISPAGASSAEDCACVAGEYCMFPEEPINKQVDVSNYAHGFCYIDATDHALYCWGQAFDAWYEGTNEMYSIPLPPGRHAIDVEVGSIGGTAGSNSPDPENVLKTHVCVHLDDLTVKCFGSNVGDVLGSNYSNKLNGTYPNTTDEVRAQGGLQFAANSLVYANSGYDTDPLKVWAHFCGLNSGDHKVVTCWGTSGWSTTKTFDTNVRGVFAYAHGTFAVLEDNSVLQWGEYGRGSFIVGGEGAGGAQSLRQWFPPKTVRSIVSVQKNVVCFQFTDHTFSCTGQNNAVRNLDYSKEGADGQVANARNWPLITFGNGTRVKSLVGSTHKFVHVLSDTDELLIVPETGFRPETILPPDPSNPIVKILLAFETQKSLFGIVVARADGSWYTAGNARGGAFGAITAKTGAIPLLEYGMPDMDMCECTLCEAGFFCPGGRHKDQCPPGDTTIQPFGSVNESDCVPLGIHLCHVFAPDCLAF